MKKLTLLFISLFSFLTMFAGEVTEAEALQKAQRFMQGKSFQQKNLRRAPSIGGPQSFYVFNADNNGGFVIVSADDRTESILGYANRGTLDVNRLPENARKWLEGYTEQIKALGNAPVKYNSSRRAIGAPVAPLVTAQWGQYSPFNNQCPMYGEEKCLTGCVATAMAQVMYYHKYPKNAVGPLPGYTDFSGRSVPELPATTFKWDQMKDKYDDNFEDSKSTDAVAELMRYCGQAVKMEYGIFASASAFNAQSMINCFGYSKTAREVWRHDYTTKEWEALIYQELKEKRPVPYEGVDDEGGHAFIVDGYDDNGLFHVNWGWNGLPDGYYVLSVLNAFDYGVGETEGNGFSNSQRAVIGLQPDHGEEAQMDLLPIYSQFWYNSSQFTRTGTEDFTINIYEYLYNWNDQETSFDHRWVLCQNGNIIKAFEPERNISIPAESSKDFDITLSFGASLEDGVYELKDMYCAVNTDTWQYCSKIQGDGNFLVTIKGSSLTLMQTHEMADQYHINSVKLDGRRETLRGMTVSMNWTYKGYDNEKTFYLWDGDENIAMVSSYLDHNETEDLYIHFVPKKTGKTTYKICTNYDQNVIWTSEPQIIEASKPQKISGTVNIAGLKKNSIESTTIDATISLKNEGQYSYNDKIVIELFTIDEGKGNLGILYKRVKQDVSLAPGGQKNINIQFDNLVKGQLYLLQARYYTINETNDRIMPYDVGEAVDCRVGTELIPYDMDIEMTVKNANSNYIIKGNTVVMDITLTNKSEYDYNDNINIEAWDTEYHYRKNTLIPVVVPAGETVTLSDQKLTGLTMEEDYYFVISYFSDNLWESVSFSQLIYTLLESTGIHEIKADDTKKVDIYNLQGRQVKTPSKGVYIINGKKVLVK